MNANQLAAIISALMGPEEQKQETSQINHGLCLVVADRGHVWVGEAYDERDYTVIEDARIVRTWGTERGLNQIAKGGPTGKTKLDEPATVKVAKRAVIAIIPCEVSEWRDK